MHALNEHLDNSLKAPFSSVLTFSIFEIGLIESGETEELEIEARSTHSSKLNAAMDYLSSILENDGSILFGSHGADERTRFLHCHDSPGQARAWSQFSATYQPELGLAFAS